MLHFHPPPGAALDPGLLTGFESGLDTLSLDRSKIPGHILGYGEISTVFEIRIGGFRGWAVKRLAIFQSPEEVGKYIEAYVEYCRLLEEDIGIRIPPHGYAAFSGDSGRPVLYIIQKMLPPSSIGNRVLSSLTPRDAPVLFMRILRELLKVWTFNGRQERLRVAIDGQISNWAFPNEGADVLYMDTSTPLFMIVGREQLNPELFLRNVPFFLRGMIRALFLEEVMTRFYNPRQIVIDLMGNLYKEQRPDLIPECVRTANGFFSEEAPDLRVRPIEADEVRAFYRKDAAIWSLFLSLRKMDRFIQTAILRRDYPYILPGKITR